MSQRRMNGVCVVEETILGEDSTLSQTSVYGPFPSQAHADHFYESYPMTADTIERYVSASVVVPADLEIAAIAYTDLAGEKVTVPVVRVAYDWEGIPAV